MWLGTRVPAAKLYNPQGMASPSDIAPKAGRTTVDAAKTHPPKTNQDKLDQLARRNAAAEEGGGAERRARQHKEGKLSARERIVLLLDEGTL